MNASNPITASVFSAYLKCPTKARLMAIGEPAPDAFFADVEARISSMYKLVAKGSLRVGGEVAETLDFGQLGCSRDHEPITHHVDCETAFYDFAGEVYGAALEDLCTRWYADPPENLVDDVLKRSGYRLPPLAKTYLEVIRDSAPGIYEVIAVAPGHGVALLKDLENIEARRARKTGMSYDAGWLWRELGIERPRRLSAA